MTTREFRFGPFVLDSGRRLLRRDEASLPLRPKSFDVLRSLLERAGEVVAKQTLFDAAWPGLSVSDESLARCVSDIRLALGDRDQTIIKTVVGRGYIVALPVASAALPSQALAASGPRWPGGPVVTLRTFAASPFDPIATDFALGLHEDLLTAFSTAGWPTRTAVVVANKDDPPRAVYVVEGRVRRAGAALVVTARLVEVATGSVIRCLRLEAEHTGCRAEGTIAASIHESFAAHLEQWSASADPGDDPRLLYAAGRRFLFGWNRPDLETALSLFKSAIAVDPGFAPAYAMAAYCHVQRISYGCADDRRFSADETERLARAAAQLMPGDPAVMATAAHALAAIVGDLDTAVRLAERAIRCGPLSSLPRYVDGWLSLFAGRPEAALPQLDVAARLAGTHPMAFKIDGAMSYACLLLGRWDEGARHAERALAQNPTYLTGRRGAAANLVLVGAKERASRHLREMRLVDPDLRVGDLGRLLPFRQPRHLETWAQALKRAGLPE